MWEQAQQALNKSVARVITSVANLLPGMVALVVALLVAVVVAWILAAVVRRSLRGVDFDRRVMRWEMPGLSEVSPGKSPTLLVSRVVFWTIILIGLLIGVAAFDATLTSALVARAFAYLPNVLAAALLLVVGNLLARFLGRSVLIGAVNMNLQYAHLLSVGVKWLVLILAATMALDHLGIGGGIVNLAFGILFGGIEKPVGS